MTWFKMANKIISNFRCQTLRFDSSAVRAHNPEKLLHEDNIPWELFPFHSVKTLSMTDTIRIWSSGGHSKFSTQSSCVQLVVNESFGQPMFALSPDDFLSLVNSSTKAKFSFMHQLSFESHNQNLWNKSCRFKLEWGLEDQYWSYC